MTAPLHTRYSNNSQDDYSTSNKPRFSDAQIRIFVYLAAFAMILFSISYTFLMNKIYISQAESCYRKQNYVCAFKAYRSAFATHINNSAYVEHYFQTLKKVKKIAVVQEELNNLLVTYPNNSAKKDIEDIFDNIRDSVLNEYPDTYINNVVQGTNIVHWNNKGNKLNVFIDKSMGQGFPGYYFTEITNAFQDYSKITNNMLDFNFVDNADQADIDVIFMQQISGDSCENAANCSGVLGLTDNMIAGSRLQKSIIKLRMKDLDNSNFTANQIYNIVKHEIGHAIGIAGHSYNSNDIMYPVSNDASWAADVQSLIIQRKDFSQRDVNTIKLLYNIVPDITNKKYNTVNYPEMYFPIAVIGTKEQIGQKNLEESRRYANTVDTSFISIVNLAEGYFGNKDYENSRLTFKEALQYAVTNDEKYTVYNNLAVIDYEVGNYDSAIQNAEVANTYSIDKASDEIIAYSYIELNKYNEAKNILENLIQKQPKNATYSAALFGIYMKQLNIFRALNEMKRIKATNPEAMNEPVYKQFGFLAAFL